MARWSLNPAIEISRIRDRNANDFQLNDNPDATQDIETFFDTWSWR